LKIITIPAAMRLWFSSAMIIGPVKTKYIYHGNDGTSMPWNDTAQLNYFEPDGA
jgi:hypothetical protein